MEIKLIAHVLLNNLDTPLPSRKKPCETGLKDSLNPNGTIEWKRMKLYISGSLQILKGITHYKQR